MIIKKKNFQYIYLYQPFKSINWLCILEPNMISNILKPILKRTRWTHASWRFRYVTCWCRDTQQTTMMDDLTFRLITSDFFFVCFTNVKWKQGGGSSFGHLQTQQIDFCFELFFFSITIIHVIFWWGARECSRKKNQTATEQRTRRETEMFALLRKPTT